MSHNYNNVLELLKNLLLLFTEELLRSLKTIHTNNHSVTGYESPLKLCFLNIV